MKQTLYTNQTLEVFIDQIKYTIDYAAAGTTPYTKEQITKSLYPDYFLAKDSSTISVNPGERKWQLIRHGKILKRTSQLRTRT